jgi:hypothetical protein
MLDELPADPFLLDPPNVWLTSFWGFDPSRWGYVGFSQEWERKSFLANTQPGCLVVIYVTKRSPHLKELQGRIVGILQLSHEIGPANLFMPGDEYALKERDPEARGKWSFGVRAIRAWRLADGQQPLIDDFAPKTYGSANAQMIGGRGVAFKPGEARKLLDLSVYEVPVYGARRTFSSDVLPLREQLKPSRAVPRSSSPYIVDELDGPKKLYVLRLKGDMAAFLGRTTAEVDGMAVIKVGYSRDPNVRCRAFNWGMPKCAFEWEVHLSSPDPAPYPSWKIAQVGENAMKQKLIELQGESLQGEFFFASSGAIRRAWLTGQSAADAAKDLQ